MQKLIKAVTALALCGAGLAHAEGCREYPLDALETMSLQALEDERERVIDLMLQGFLVEGAEISEAAHAGCVAQGRILDALILAHRSEAAARKREADAKAAADAAGQGS